MVNVKPCASNPGIAAFLNSALERSSFRHCECKEAVFGLFATASSFLYHVEPLAA